MDLCKVCDITNDIIDMQSLDCGSESVLVYRARLEGTSRTDSGSLINLIEDWVSSGPRVLVTGTLIKVDSQCPVLITSLTDVEICITIDQSTQSPDDSSSMSLVLIIGIVAAVIIFIIIHIILVTAILVYRHGNKKKDTTINR